MVAFDLLEHTHQALRVDRGIHFDVQHLAVEIIHDVEGAKSAVQVGASLMKSTDQTVSGSLGT